MSEKKLMNIKDVANYLNVNEKTIYRMLSDESIPAVKISGSWRFDRREIEQWVGNKMTGKKNSKTSKKPKVISLFSGCGGLDLGFDQCGYETVWANDFDTWAAQTFTHNFGNVMHCGDIEEIDP